MTEGFWDENKQKLLQPPTGNPYTASGLPGIRASGSPSGFLQELLMICYGRGTFLLLVSRKPRSILSQHPSQDSPPILLHWQINLRPIVGIGKSGWFVIK